MKYYCLERLDSLLGIRSILDTDGPALCEVIVDPDQDFHPKLVSKMLVDGTFSTPSLEDMYPFLDKNEMADNIYISPTKV